MEENCFTMCWFLPYSNVLLLLLSCFSHVRLCATPEMAAHQAPLSLGFSRQEHWSGLPFPSPMHESEKWKWSRWVVSDPQRPHGLQPTRLLHPWDFPGKKPLPSPYLLFKIFSHFYYWFDSHTSPQLSQSPSGLGFQDHLLFKIISKDCIWFFRLGLLRNIHSNTGVICWQQWAV